MKLKKEFITHNIGDETMMVNSSSDKNAFHGMVKSNETASFIIELLKNEVSKQDILDKMLETYEVDADTASNAIDYVINELRKINAIEE